jgi:hypothetical protein
VQWQHQKLHSINVLLKYLYNIETNKLEKEEKENEEKMT